MHTSKQPAKGTVGVGRIVGLLILGFLACGQPGTENPESIKKEILETKRNIQQLEKKVGDLQDRLNTLEPQEDKAVLPVKTKTLEYESFEHFFEANGSIEAVREAHVGAEVSGRIKSIHVREGDRVEKGDLLISINSSIIENTLAEVRTSLNLARTIYKRRKRLWEKKIGSELEFLQAKNNKESLEDREKALQAQLEMTRIKAPISGIVEQIAVKKGAMALPGVNLLHIVDLNQIYINADISESYLGKVRTGDPVAVTFPARPDFRVETRIHRMGNVINPENRTVEIQMILKNRDGSLKPNNLAILRLKDFSTDRALVVPSIVIKKDLNGEYVYVVTERDGLWLSKKTYIDTGLSQGNATMVKSGLSPGQQVIVEGYNQVKNNLAVQPEASG